MEKIHEQEQSIKKQMLILQHQLNTLKNIKNNMKYIENEEVYERVYLKDRLFLPASHGNQFSVSTYECFSKWVELLPITTYCKIINKEDAINSGNTEEKLLPMHYGIAINEEDAHLLKPEERGKVKHLKGGPCLLFYSDQFNYGIKDKNPMEQVMIYMEENNLEIDGDIFLEGARVTVNQFGKGNMVYVPIKEKY